MKLPKHNCGLTLEHNVHKSLYEHASDCWEISRGEDVWESQEAKDKAILTDEVWTLQWYPDTPIGFFKIAAPTLEELLTFALKIEQKAKEET